MTLPPATFAAVAPPVDGLATAFRSARRRRNSKATVSAFAVAVAVTSALSLLAPPGQTLLQQPLPPAGGGSGLVPGLPVAPPRVAPVAPDRAVAGVPRSPVVVAPARPQAGVGRPAARPSVVTFSAQQVGRELSCQARTGPFCAGISTRRDPGRTAAQATFCPSAASARASYTVPQVQEAGTVEVATRSCS